MELSVTLMPYRGEILACARLDGIVVGTADYDVADGSFARVWTHPQARKRGVASAIYAEVEALGHTIVPSETLTPDGMAFWRARGMDPARNGSRLVQGGQGAGDAAFAAVDVSEVVAAWDEHRLGPKP